MRCYREEHKNTAGTPHWSPINMKKEEFILNGSSGMPMLTDAYYFQNGIKKPVIIFSHGFKGFKDWGHFDLIAKEFAESGFVFIKFNFSHNGTTIDQPNIFADLEAFGQNNFSKELNDLGTVIDHVTKKDFLPGEADTEKLFLVGHSRGGGITLLKCAEDRRVKKAAAWASIGETEKRMHPPELEEWEKNGVVYIHNARTKQEMPLYFQLHEDYVMNKPRLDLSAARSRIDAPVLLVHGTHDTTVAIDEARHLHAGIKNSKLEVIENADHAFGGKEPWAEHRLPLHTLECIWKTIVFLNT